MSGPVRVLVVDDAPFMRRAIVKILAADPSIEVVGEAGNGREAVDRAEELRPDVICLDLDMPQMDGLTALKHLMARRPTPVVVVSSLTDRANVPFETLRLGVLDFFPKPTATDGEIENRARHLLYLVRNAGVIRREKLRRVPIEPSRPRLDAPARSSRVLAIGGTVGSISGFLRVMAVLPSRPAHRLSVLCQLPIHPAIVSSFVDSLTTYFGWKVERLSGLPPIRPGVATIVPPDVAVAWKGDQLGVLDGSEEGLNGLFAACGERFGPRATLVLLAGERPEGQQGLASAAARGSVCFVQDEQTAMFSSWSPALDRTIGRFDLDRVLESLGEALGRGAADDTDDDDGAGG